MAELKSEIIELGGNSLHISKIEQIIKQSIPVEWKLTSKINKTDKKINNKNLIKIGTYLLFEYCSWMEIYYNDKIIEIYPSDILFREKAEFLKNKIYEHL